MVAHAYTFDNNRGHEINLDAPNVVSPVCEQVGCMKGQTNKTI